MVNALDVSRATPIGSRQNDKSRVGIISVRTCVSTFLVFSHSNGLLLLFFTHSFYSKTLRRAKLLDEQSFLKFNNSNNIHFLCKNRKHLSARKHAGGIY